MKCISIMNVDKIKNIYKEIMREREREREREKSHQDEEEIGKTITSFSSESWKTGRQ